MKEMGRHLEGDRLSLIRKCILPSPPPPFIFYFTGLYFSLPLPLCLLFPAFSSYTYSAIPPSTFPPNFTTLVLHAPSSSFPMCPSRFHLCFARVFLYCSTLLIFPPLHSFLPFNPSICPLSLLFGGSSQFPD